MSKPLLLVSELLHSFAHIIVLIHIQPFILTGTTRQFYFIWDVASVVASWYVTKKNKDLVLLHVLLHVPALAHLFDTYPTALYANVFKIASTPNSVYDIPVAHYGVYFLGTCLDIYCHLKNVQYLSATYIH